MADAGLAAAWVNDFPELAAGIVAVADCLAVLIGAGGILSCRQCSEEKQRQENGYYVRQGGMLFLKCRLLRKARN